MQMLTSDLASWGLFLMRKLLEFTRENLLNCKAATSSSAVVLEWKKSHHLYRQDTPSCTLHKTTLHNFPHQSWEQPLLKCLIKLRMLRRLDNSLGSDDGPALNPQLWILCQCPPAPENNFSRDGAMKASFKNTNKNNYLPVQCSRCKTMDKRRKLSPSVKIICECWSGMNVIKGYLLTRAAAFRVSAPWFLAP